MAIAEFLLILLIVLVLFGRNLPDVGEGLGKAVRNFRKAVREPDEIDVTPPNKEEDKAKKSAS